MQRLGPCSEMMAMQSRGVQSNALRSGLVCPAHHHGAQQQRSARLSQRGSVAVAATTSLHKDQKQVQPLHTEAACMGSKVVIMHASSSRDYWSAADVHCRVFHEEKAQPGPAAAAAALAQGTGQLSELPQRIAVMKALLDRVDRVACLQSLEDHAITGAGKCTLILAFDKAEDEDSTPSTSTPSPSSSPSSPSKRAATTAAAQRQQQAPLSNELRRLLKEAEDSPVFSWLLKSLLHGHAGSGLGVAAEDRKLIGVCFVDSFGDLVPPRELDADRDGAFGWVKRAGIAYISNVAVLPSARGRGAARQLVLEAQAEAERWGCRSIGLHCNKKNTPAVSLYTSLGYRMTVQEPAIMPYLNGRPPDRCHFYIKRLPSSSAVATA